MSIRFRCPHCGQKLRVGEGKRGQAVLCPRCKNPVTVTETIRALPEEESPPPPVVAPRDPALGPARAPIDRLPEIVERDDDIEWVYETDEPPMAVEAAASDDHILLPRRVLYVQGILLGTVAIVSFVLGLLARGSRPGAAALSEGPRPCLLTGYVTWSPAGQPRPDPGSAVMALPVQHHPPADRKVAFEGLRPGDPEPLAENASLQAIRRLGGDYARTDSQGAFQMRVADTGSYYLLVISSHRQRPPQEALVKRDIAQMGRYFQSPLDLLSDRHYRWTQITVRRDQALADVQF